MQKIRVFEAFAGYGSQLMALKRLQAAFPNEIEIEPIGISEIDPHAIKAYQSVHGDVTNYGDISKIDWSQVPDFDLFTYSSPCFVAGTLVLTKRGYIPIEEIIVGDYVLTHTNNWRKVVRTGSKIANQIVELKGMSFDNIKCTINHPFYTRNKYRYGHFRKRMFEDPKWTEAGLLDKDKYLGYSIVQNEDIPLWNGVKDNRWGHGRISNRITPILVESNFWYIMGRYVGDGWTRTSNNGSSVFICCGGRNEQQLIDAFNNIGFHYTKIKERTVNKYRICSNELFEFVKRYGKGAANKRIDIETMMLPKHLLKSFMKGYFHSDGYFNAKTEEYKFSSVSRQLVYGVQMCIAKVFERPTALYFTKRKRQTTIEGRLVNQKYTYEVKFHKDARKQDKAFHDNRQNWFPVSMIEKYIEPNIVYNLEVEIDNSYTANGVIVHNCQDFSNAGKQSGGTEGSGTRSSLLWECRKAILAKKPKYLLMENVAALVQAKFIKLFNKWQLELESYGYKNFAKVLNAKNYNVPQNRERIFMVSILDENAKFEFPQPMPLNRKLKDVLEKDVDEKYYLSEERLQGLKISTQKEKDAGRGFAFKPKNENDETANSVTTHSGGRKTDNFIKTVGNLYDTSTSRKAAGIIVDDGGGLFTTLRAGDNSKLIEYGEKDRVENIEQC